MSERAPAPRGDLTGPAHPEDGDLDELEELQDEEAPDGEDEAGTRRWVRYVMPVMVEVDVDADRVTRVVTLPSEIREDRDDLGHWLIYDEGFVRRHDDDQPQAHAWAVAEPRWPHARFIAGTPTNWPSIPDWEEGFDLTEADDAYSEINPYDEPQR